MYSLSYVEHQTTVLNHLGETVKCKQSTEKAEGDGSASSRVLPLGATHLSTTIYGTMLFYGMSYIIYVHEEVTGQHIHQCGMITSSV